MKRRDDEVGFRDAVSAAAAAAAAAGLVEARSTAGTNPQPTSADNDRIVVAKLRQQNAFIFVVDGSLFATSFQCLIISAED